MFLEQKIGISERFLKGHVKITKKLHFKIYYNRQQLVHFCYFSKGLNDQTFYSTAFFAIINRDDCFCVSACSLKGNGTEGLLYRRLCLPLSHETLAARLTVFKKPHVPC